MLLYGTVYYEDDDIIDDSGIDSKYCPYCSGSAYTEKDLLNFILNKFNMSEKELVKEFKKTKGK